MGWIKMFAVIGYGMNRERDSFGFMFEHKRWNQEISSSKVKPDVGAYETTTVVTNVKCRLLVCQVFLCRWRTRFIAIPRQGQKCTCFTLLWALIWIRPQFSEALLKGKKLKNKANRPSLGALTKLRKVCLCGKNEKRWIHTIRRELRLPMIHFKVWDHDGYF